MGRDGECCIVPDRGHDRIVFLSKSVKIGRCDPGLVNELELPLDIGVDAHEEQAAGLPLPVRPSLDIRAPDPENAMPVRNRDLVLVAWL